MATNRPADRTMTHPLITTPTNYRALCSAAIELWEADCDMESVISDMRTALAQPEPVGPTLDDIVTLCADHEFTLGFDGANEEESAEVLLEIVLAVLARWGRPAVAAGAEVKS